MFELGYSFDEMKIRAIIMQLHDIRCRRQGRTWPPDYMERLLQAANGLESDGTQLIESLNTETIIMEKGQ